MPEPFVFDGVSVEAGTKRRHFVTVATRPGGAPVGFPVFMAHGVRPGPVFCAVSGVHGDEYEGREAIRRVCEALDA
ncbi:MAG: succinylglutamate desuccinylase, partial [Armatimonadetes bacterium]|nr:succinylglutamate desuccinylase [Armatimonadota bacterium]